MDKFFAKTQFLGKKIIYLPQCHSTNDKLLELIDEGRAREGDVIVTDHQNAGRGQRGNSWESEPNANLLFSVMLTPRFVSLQHQHYLTMIAGLATHDAVRKYLPDQFKSIKIKWPNDVYVNEKKIAGILCESSIAASQMEFAVVGIGLNVNQKFFENEKATSMFFEKKETIERYDLLENLLVRLEYWYIKLKGGHLNQILDVYQNELYWKDQQRIFKENEIEFTGKIKGISAQGHLIVESDHTIKSYSVQQIRFIR